MFCFGDQVLIPGSSLATDFLGVVPLWRVAQEKFFQPWCDVELWFDIDETRGYVRRELALQIEVDVA